MTSPICSHLPSMASHGQGVCPCPLVGFGHVLGTGWWHFSTQDSVMVLSHWRSQTFPLTVSAPLLTWQEFPMDNWWPIQVCGSRGRCVGTLGSQIYCVKHNHPTKPGVDQQNPRRPTDMWATVNHSCSKALVPGGGGCYTAIADRYTSGQLTTRGCRGARVAASLTVIVHKCTQYTPHSEAIVFCTPR